MTTVNTQALGFSDVVNTIHKAVRSLDYINKKWWAQYFDDCGWVSLYSTKSGMEVLFPVVIKITDTGVVELRESEDDWAFFRLEPEEGCWSSDEVVDTLSSVMEDELTRFISRYWASK